MKEITRISLASLPYNIELGAKKELEKYLHAIESALGADSDAMKEIEARIAELFADRGVSGEKVISLADIDAVKAQLGNPKDFTDESTKTELGEEIVTTTSERKLLRDTNDQVIGGVCAGLAAYTHVDTVWVRLGFIILAVVTSGVMIPIYLVMWLVMPPAKTAAERVQMKGAPVTLEALQEESAVVAKQRDRDKTVLKFLRILGGVGALIVAATAIMGMTSIGYKLVRQPSMGSFTLGTHEQLYIGAVFAAGICFVVFCFIIARMLFTGHTTKRSWITLGIVTAVGLGTFATGVTGYGLLHYTGSQEYDKATVVATQDASAIPGATSLVTNSNNASVRYVVTSGQPKVELQYNTISTQEKPQVHIARNGDVLEVGVFADQSMMCMGYCQELARVTVYGPELRTVSASTGSVAYHSAGQKALALIARERTDISLEGTKAIEELTVTSESANVDMVDANVMNATVTADNQSRVALGNIAKLSLTAPTTCSNGNKLDIVAAAAQSVSINGTEWKGGAQTTPCMNFALGNNEE